MVIHSPQLTNYSCGPACLSFIASLAGLSFTEAELIEAVSARPMVGTDNQRLAAWCEANLSDVVGVVGEHVYQDGVALANILNPETGNGHFVVMLGRLADGLLYWCPHYGVRVVEEESIAWSSGDGSYQHWAITFPGLSCPSTIFRKPVVHFIGDPLETLKQFDDTSLHLQAALQAAGVPAIWHTDKSICLKRNTLWLDGLQVAACDLVIVRLEPRDTSRYLELMRVLAHADATCINAPMGILKWHDKLGAFAHRSGTAFACGSEEQLRRALKHLAMRGIEKVVIKKPSSFGGDGIRFGEGEAAVACFNEAARESGYAIVEPQVEFEVRPQDARIFVAYGEVLGGVYRVAPEGSKVCNIAAGATTEPIAQFRPANLETIARVWPRLAKDGVVMAGFDFLDDELTEINTSCPGALWYIQQAGALDVFDRLARKIIENHQLLVPAQIYP